MRETFAPRAASTLLAALGALTALPADALEIRLIPNSLYMLGVQFGQYPTVAGQPTKVEVIAAYGDILNDGNAVDLDRTKGDIVDLQAVAFRVDSEDFNAPITEYLPMQRPYKFTQMLIPGDIAYGQAFTPKEAGAYGLVVSGYLKKKGQGKGVSFAEKFVCGAGTRDANLPVFLHGELQCVQSAP